MRRNIMVGAVGVAGLLLAAWGAPATAGMQPATEEPGGGGPTTAAGHRAAIATFEGRRIDLSKDWGEAQACLVWRQGGVLECFRTAASLDARIAQLSPERAGPPGSPGPPGSTATRSYSAWSYSCSSSLRLFEHAYYGGRQLSYWDRGYWQNLGDYGFNDRASSYAVGGCYVHLAEHVGGGGAWYPGPTYPYAGEAMVSSGWNDVISSIYIE